MYSPEISRIDTKKMMVWKMYTPWKWTNCHLKKRGHCFKTSLSSDRGYACFRGRGSPFSTLWQFFWGVSLELQKIQPVLYGWLSIGWFLPKSLLIGNGLFKITKNPSIKNWLEIFWVGWYVKIPAVKFSWNWGSWIFSRCFRMKKISDRIGDIAFRIPGEISPMKCSWNPKQPVF